ncbi:hypothetical protein [Bacillus sp. AK128]
MRKTLFTVSASVLMALMLFLNGCSTKNETSLAQLIYNNIPESEGVQVVYHIEVIDYGFLVFYRSNGGLRAGVIDQKFNWITKSGEASLNPEKGLSAVFSNREEVLYFSYGVVKNPDIVEVTSSNDKKAKIIKTNEGIRLWFISYDQPLDSILPDIIGLSIDGEQLVNSNDE